ncbi:imidazolonepropionase [bacterium]|nr:imidazolonepropionase [bacterium]
MQNGIEFEHITTDQGLIDFCEAVRGCEFIGFDTEFVSESRYRPQLCLVQVAADGRYAIIDTLAVKDISVFWDLLVEGDHVTVVHAAREEFMFCYRACGRRPKKLFDVQLGAGMTGLEYPASYGNLVSRLLGSRVDKGETRTDWMRRPLSNRQIDYALSDVTHLKGLFDVVSTNLNKLNRMEWFEAEMDIWQNSLERAENEPQWQRVAGISNLNRRALAIVRELWIARDKEAKQGGGILSTVSATRAASEEELFQTAAERIKFLLSEGVTTVEIKSGYGLNLDSELKMLRVANRLGLEFPVSVEATLLAAHAVAPEFKGNPDAFIQHVCDTIIPQSAGLCSSVDAFCETIAFDLTQTKRVFECAQQQGLNIKVHAEQLSHTGAAALAANMGAISADHLEYLSADDCATLSRQGTVATLLPGAFYCLNEKQKPPIAALRDNQVSIAIATDSNPGSSPVLSLLLMGNMACNLFGLTPSEAIAGMTINAAKALKLDQSIGSIEKNKQADFATWNVNSPAEILYGIGGNPSAGIYKLGKRTQF